MDVRSSSEYTPAEDTFFIADNIKSEHGHLALDVGSGSGYLTDMLTRNFEYVVGTDIVFSVLRDQTYRTPNLICCNAADALHVLFDLVICNMPYLATNTIQDVATDGGIGGLEIPSKILNSVYSRIRLGGKFVFVSSSLSDYYGLIKHADMLGFNTKIIARKRLFFEELILLSAVKSQRLNSDLA